MARNDQLIVAETFYSIQGEGPSVGQPAVFLRLSGCNLQCEGFTYRHPETGEHLGCDTKHVWRHGQQYSFEELLTDWQTKGWLQALQEGAHLVITGGEPLLQQPALSLFIDALVARIALRENSEKKSFHPYIEIETNATYLFTPNFLKKIHQINASPKLTHSGELISKAYCLDVLTQLALTPHAYFKFVLSKRGDINEVIQRYVKPLALSPHRIWLMPEGSTAEGLAEKSQWIVELCKDYHFHYSPRLQVHIWGEVVGV